MDLPGGTIGRFEIVGLLGRGGMGVVLAARDPSLDRTVAIKLVPELWIGEANQDRTRFTREAQAMAQLNHPNVITIYEVGDADQKPFIAMEYVEGPTLRAWQSAQRRTWRELLAMYLAAGRGLAALHRAGLVHRDFKPDNVLIGSDLRPRVSDFGLAAELGEAVATGDSDVVDGARGLTVRGRIVGTPPYMAREQWSGQPATAQTDQFAFCASLWEAIFRERPFAGESASELKSAICDDRRRTPPSNSGAPRWLAIALERGLHGDSDARWSSMDELLAVLETRSRRAWWPFALAASIVLVGGGAALARSVLVTNDQPCEAPSERVAMAWGAGGREGFANQLRAIDPVNATARLATIDRFVRPRLADWQRLSVDACRASGARDVLVDQRSSCLDERLAELTGMLSRIRDARDGATLDRAIPALADLSSAVGCADAKVLASFTSPPLAADRFEAAAIAAQTRAIELDRIAGQLTGLHERGTTVLAHARRLGHAPTTARALQVVARMEADRDADGVAIELLRELITVAARAPDDHAAAFAWTNLLRLTAFNLRRPAEALAMLPAAEAAVLRAGEPVDLRVLLLQQRAEVYMEVQRIPEAYAALEDAQKLLSASGADDPASPLRDRVAEVWSTLGSARLRARAWDEAIAAYEQALRIENEVYGPDHPLTAYAYLNIAYAHRQQQRLDRALAANAEAVRVRRARLGPSPGLAWAINAHANALRELERPKEAEPEAEEALAMADATMAVDDPQRIYITLGAAALAQDVGKIDRARELYTAAIDLGERTGTRNTNVAISLFNRAELARNANRCALGLPDYERATSLFVEYGDTYVHYQAFSLRGLGQCLLVLGRIADARATLERAIKLPEEPITRDQMIASRYLRGVAMLRGGDREAGRAAIAAARAEALAISKELRAELDTLLADD